MINARATLLLAFVVLLVFESMAGASDEMLARARDLYQNAAYDEALVVLNQITDEAESTSRVEVNEYRLFCLVALGRKDEARSTIEALIEADPFYQLPTERASPRIRAMFTEIRQALLPGIVQRAYADAKAAFDKQDPKSTVRFQRVIDLLNDPDVASRPALADLRIVTSGFRDLSKAFGQPAPPAPVAPAPVPPVEPSPAASPSSASSATTVYREGDVGVVAPVALNQTLPPFVGGPFQPREMVGALELLVDENGNVISATVITSINPRYDERLVKAAMLWKFSPGRKDGKAVLVRKTLRVRVLQN
jgi:hypothetical protein